ncbi:MAG TPA: hypothetical protein VGL99_20305 [Chloroflexota bacterium]
MRSVPATLLAFLLLLMLSVTTPMGTADGVHSAVLLHPLFSHTHFVDGRIVFHRQLDDTPSSSTNRTGPAMGAEAGSTTAAAGPALSPTLPMHDLTIEHERHMRSQTHDVAAPRGLAMAPPDPPPTFGS